MLLTRALSNEKEIRWVGSSLEDLLAFPITVRKASVISFTKFSMELNPMTGNRFQKLGLG